MLCSFPGAPAIEPPALQPYGPPSIKVDIGTDYAPPVGVTDDYHCFVIDPGFKGTVVLELSNVANLPILLRPGMKIAQMVFQKLDRPAERPYGHPALGSKYQGQSGAVASKYDQNTL